MKGLSSLEVMRDNDKPETMEKFSSFICSTNIY